MENNNTVLKSNQNYENPFSKSNNVDYASEQLLDRLKFAKKLDEEFSTIKGQDALIQRIKEKLFDNAYANNNKVTAFFMVGAPGVGKTASSVKIAKCLGLPYKLFSASGYTDMQMAMPLLTGAQRSFKDAKAGILTNFVYQNAFSVIIVDEIEKAHPAVLQLFLGILEEGVCYDNFLEKEISFRNCIIIFTSNACKEIWDRSNRYIFSDVPTSTIIKSLRREIHPQMRLPVFSEAFISRISGNIWFYNNLRPQTVKEIVVQAIGEEVKSAYDLDKLTYKLDVEALAELLILNGGESADLRTLLTTVKNFFASLKTRSTQVANEISKNRKLFDKINIEISIDDASEDAWRLLKNNHPARVLVTDKHLLKRKDIPTNVEVIVTDSNIDARKVNAMDISLAILSAKDSDTRHIFDAVMAQGDVPVYVYSNGENAKSKLFYYSDHGATEIATVDIAKWAIDIVKSISFTYAVSMARRSGKVFNFDRDIRYDADKYVVDVQLHNIRTEIAKDAGDESGFVADRDIPNVDFTDIIGAEPAKKELMSIARFLKDYKKYQRAGLRIPRGVLLFGEPGTGKTMLAKAEASLCDLPFLSINATELLNKYVGEGVKKVRELFDRARRFAPAILFIDEIDIIARSRMSEYSDNHHTNDLVNAFLSELDGFNTQNQPPIFVIATTNFDVTKGNTKLDEAFLRRFDKKIRVDLPSCEERIAYIEMEMSKIPNNSVTNSQISVIAKRAVAWCLADLNLVIQNAIRQYEDATGIVGVDNKSLIESFESFHDGEQKKHPDEKTMEHIAYHEAGHSVLSFVLGFPTIHTTIASRSNYGGFVQSGDETKTLFTKGELLDRIVVALAGRASEIMFCKDVTTGASGDIRSATNIAMRMICDYGMSDDGSLLFIDQSGNSNLSEQKEKANKILATQYERAQKLIQDYREAIEKVAYELLRKNSLTEEELKAIMNGYL